MDLPNATTSLDGWTHALAQPTNAPAGGSAAALAGAMAASLVTRVAGMTIERRYTAVHPEARHIQADASRLRAALLTLASDDAQLLADLSQALALPKGTESERAERARRKQRALAEGARVQLEVARGAAAVAELGSRVAILGPSSTVGDASAAVFLAAAAARSAYWAARLDTSSRETVTVGQDLLHRIEAAEHRVSRLLEERLS